MLNAHLLFLAIACVFPQEPATVLDPDIAKWEDAIANLEKRDQDEPQTKDAVLFYGSSSIRLWDSIAEDMQPWPVIQRGYGGAKLTDAIHYAPRVIGPHLGENNPRRARAVVVFVANDIVGKKNELNNDGSPEEVANRYQALHQWIRKQDASIPFFWIEVTPTGARWHVWDKIETATKRIEQIAATDPNSQIISTAGAYLNVHGIPKPELFVDDKLHLNEAGYDLWAELIKSALHKTLGPAIEYRFSKWEPEIQQLERLTSEGRPILFYGSSSLRKWETMAADLAPWPVLNCGYGGASLDDAAHFADRIIGPQDPKAIVLFIGNDVYGRNRQPEVAAKDFKRMLQSIRKSKPDIPIVWIGIRPTIKHFKQWDKAKLLNQMVSEVCMSDDNAQVVDFSHRFLNAENQPNIDLFDEDKVHLSQEGYLIWADEIKQGIAKIFDSETEATTVSETASGK